MENNSTDVIKTEKALYEGKVSVQVFNGKKLVNEYSLHNNGCSGLFEFLAYCLCGDWSNVKDKIPCRVILFDKYKEEPTAIKNWTDEKEYWTSDLKCSYSVRFDTTPVIEDYTEDEIVLGKQVTLHFRIPFLYISKGTIYKVALYPDTISDPYNDRCAYFLFTEDGEELSGITIPEDANNFTLVINWTLVFTNNKN